MDQILPKLQKFLPKFIHFSVFHFSVFSTTDLCEILHHIDVHLMIDEIKNWHFKNCFNEKINLKKIKNKFENIYIFERMIGEPKSLFSRCVWNVLGFLFGDFFWLRSTAQTPRIKKWIQYIKIMANWNRIIQYRYFLHFYKLQLLKLLKNFVW